MSHSLSTRNNLRIRSTGIHGYYSHEKEARTQYRDCSDKNGNQVLPNLCNKYRRNNNRGNPQYVVDVTFINVHCLDMKCIPPRKQKAGRSQNSSSYWIWKWKRAKHLNGTALRMETRVGQRRKTYSTTFIPEQSEYPIFSVGYRHQQYDLFA